ncbi:protein-L-isoaspartate(D-aspartate) O-methyltransferase [Sphingomonas sp.]|uniref:protein-L-isoaspartate(D-aspartate) O-methyltransferase n=1 Tax=Sphingomonas sp. TaxID=28214 RepID=UPI002FC72741
MKNLLSLLPALALLGIGPTQAAAVAPADEAGEYQAARERLVDFIHDYPRAIGERPDPRILAALRQVPRHLFVPEAARAEAYQDYPLPIGKDQTISQPSLVALMTHLLRPKPGDVILEVGTGSGYQAAILSPLVGKVYSIEIVEALARQATRRLDELGYGNVQVRHGDGYLGWPEHAPFDGIIVTAGAPHVPKPLLDQLKRGGHMVIPVGSTLANQELKVITKDQRGRLSERTIIGVRFVPLTRQVRG